MQTRAYGRDASQIADIRVPKNYPIPGNSLCEICVVADSESATESADISRVRLNPNPRIFFAAVSDGFGSSVCESIFTYQVAAFK